MKIRKSVIGAGAALLAGVGWYLFRPELLFVNERVNESLPGSVAAASDMGPKALASGQFHGVAHETQGSATLYQLNGGARALRLTGFKTSNGPDVHIYLVAAADARDSQTVAKAGFLDLGKLKGNEGDQNYDVPASLDLQKYRAATIWCKRFSVNFGTAPLAPSAASMGAPGPVAAGRFHSVAHETQGTATVYELEGGNRIVRLTGFKTSNGPDVHVYVVAAPDAGDNAAVTRAGFIDLGKLKGNEGDQNYDLPANADLAKYRAVTIWCKRFSVNFATAPLMAKG